MINRNTTKTVNAKYYKRKHLLKIQANSTDFYPPFFIFVLDYFTVPVSAKLVFLARTPQESQ
ncbi:MAG: hypothetical protein MJ060_04570, partial [Clostridia bacterium]|nr:hypothetical protein [Clostridia bacterium]